jgi:hypothetical protein
MASSAEYFLAFSHTQRITLKSKYRLIKRFQFDIGAELSEPERFSHQSNSSLSVHVQDA